ncbi:hypothetical protein [Streptomyces sp. IBSBF 2390]|uniref:hypothetical protein n=1 Tax=Streptomyces sp. IBSBF 2390 TaxID=2903533 RepID=UPI003FA7D12F
MPAHAILAVEHAHLPVPAALIPLTCDAIRRLFITHAVRPLHDVDHRPNWSRWRRRHRARSRAGQYWWRAAPT